MKKLLALTTAFMALPLVGQTVAFTTPSGYVKTDLAVGFNPIGINLHGQILVSGTIDSESGAVITDADVDFAAALTDANSTYLFEVSSGTQDGTVSKITAISTSTITIEGVGLAAGTANYTIRKARTLNEIFGTGASAQLNGGFSLSGNVDRVWILNDSGTYENFFYSTLLSQFVDDGGNLLSKPVSVYYPEAIYVQVPASSPTTQITIFGEIKTTPTAAIAFNGFNLIAMQNPVGQKLNELNLQSFLTGGFSVGGADVVFIEDTAGDFVQYYYNTLVSEWRLVSGSDDSSQNDGGGPSAFYIKRNSASTVGGKLELPSFFNSL